MQFIQPHLSLLHPSQSSRRRSAYSVLQERGMYCRANEELICQMYPGTILFSIIRSIWFCHERTRGKVEIRGARTVSIVNSHVGSAVWIWGKVGKPQLPLRGSIRRYGKRCCLLCLVV
ncbi:unnamed protein product [Amoebophrya sp. A120]|nr:unnamed protein product [Amoebophrya sp. A120]|eukprot:GSA120T00020554001.1